MRKEIKLTDLCSQLKDDYLETIKVDNQSQIQVSPERIKKLTLAKLENGQDTTEGQGSGGKHMRKASIRVLMIAAIVCVLSVTVFALSGTDFFRSIFGESITLVEDQIINPVQPAEGNGWKMSLQSVLTDGYMTNLIVSLESETETDFPDDESGGRLRALPKDGTMLDEISSGYEPMEGFNTKNRRYYLLHLDTKQRQDTIPLTIQFFRAEDEEPVLEMETSVSSSMANHTFDISAEDYEGKNFRPIQIQITPLVAQMIGEEKEAKRQIPYPIVQLRMEDGKIEDIFTPDSIDQSGGPEDGVSTGAGSVVLDGTGEILVYMTTARRNPDGEIVAQVTFSRVLDLEKVAAVVVDGKEYPMK